MSLLPFPVAILAGLLRSSVHPKLFFAKQPKIGVSSPRNPSTTSNTL